MVKIKRLSGRAISMPAGIAVGICSSLLIMLCGAMILAWLVISERLAQASIGYGVMLIHVLAVAVGAVIASGLTKRRRLAVCGICTVGYYVMLLVIALLFGGQFDGMGVTALTVLAGGGIAVILGLVGNGSGVRRRKIPAYR